MGQAVHQVVVERSGEILASRVQTADGPWLSFRGLMLRAQLPEGHGMHFRPARGIHTQFMRFPIDLVFLDADGRVAKIREAMKPWRFDFSRADSVIELNAGDARSAGVCVGDALAFEQVTR